jgi:phosphate:Na+ symporter
MISTLLGGIGLFLLGMLLLSEGLKSAAGGALRSILQRFARTPLRAVISGASVTALVQSSSATTLTTIGFVSAGLLTFPQAVGLIFGANLGTTSTGWLVSVLGFRMDMGAVALPLVGAGALLRLLARGRWAHGGMALAGFGLIFVGIDLLQDAMGSVAEEVDPTRLPGASLGGRLVLVLAGAALTVLMQSSSAAVATTLAALHAGGIDLTQAGLLVVGQNLGTSVKAILAALGGGVPVRRTAAAHTLFNVITAGLALALFPLLLGGALRVTGDPAMAVALFHSAFNLLGVAVLFPVLGRFARLVERLVPERGPSLTRNLDPAVAEVPEVAVEAARRSTDQVARHLARAVAGRLVPAAGAGALPTLVAELAPALVAIRDFLARVRTHPDHPVDFARHLSVLHALDHLDRLEELRREFDDLGATLPDDVLPLGRELSRALLFWSEAGEAAPEGSGGGEEEAQAAQALGVTSRGLAAARKARRERILEEVAAGRGSPDEGRVRILHLKRVDRAGYHAWRAAHHLAAASTWAGSAGSAGSGEEAAGAAP